MQRSHHLDNFVPPNVNSTVSHTQIERISTSFHVPKVENSPSPTCHHEKSLIKTTFKRRALQASASSMIHKRAGRPNKSHFLMNKHSLQRRRTCEDFVGRIRHPKNKQEDFRRVCSVCYLPAEYYNSGAISCESCKMFFRRNYDKLHSLQCVSTRKFQAKKSVQNFDLKDGTSIDDQDVPRELDSLTSWSCDLRQTGKKRLCALCRLKKCYMVGMRPVNHGNQFQLQNMQLLNSLDQTSLPSKEEEKKLPPGVFACKPPVSIKKEIHQQGNDLLSCGEDPHMASASRFVKPPSTSVCSFTSEVFHQSHYESQKVKYNMAMSESLQESAHCNFINKNLQVDAFQTNSPATSSATAALVNADDLSSNESLCTSWNVGKQKLRADATKRPPGHWPIEVSRQYGPFFADIIKEALKRKVITPSVLSVNWRGDIERGSSEDDEDPEFKHLCQTHLSQNPCSLCARAFAAAKMSPLQGSDDVSKMSYDLQRNDGPISPSTQHEIMESDAGDSEDIISQGPSPSYHHSVKVDPVEVRRSNYVDVSSMHRDGQLKQETMTSYEESCPKSVNPQSIFPGNRSAFTSVKGSGVNATFPHAHHVPLASATQPAMYHSTPPSNTMRISQCSACPANISPFSTSQENRAAQMTQVLSLSSSIYRYQLRTPLLHLAESDLFLRVLLATPNEDPMSLNPCYSLCSELDSKLAQPLQNLLSSRFASTHPTVQQDIWSSLRYFAEELSIRTVAFCQHVPPMHQWNKMEKQSILKTRLTVMVCHLAILFPTSSDGVSEIPGTPYVSWPSALAYYRSQAALLQPFIANQDSSVFPSHLQFIKNMNELLQDDVHLRLIFIALKLYEVLPMHIEHLRNEQLYAACISAFRRYASYLWQTILFRSRSRDQHSQQHDSYPQPYPFRPHHQTMWNPMAESMMDQTLNSAAALATAKSQWRDFCQLYAWSRYHFDIGCIQEVSSLHSRNEMGDLLRSLSVVIDNIIN